MPRIIHCLYACVLLITASLNLNAQSEPEIVSKKVSKLLWASFNADKVKDSTAVYGAVLTIVVKKGELGFAPSVKIEINDKEVAAFFGDLDTIKKIDYTNVLAEKKQVDLFLKIYVLVTNSKYEAQLIDIENTWDMFSKTQFVGEGRMINLGMSVIKTDKKVYH